MIRHASRALPAVIAMLALPALGSETIHAIPSPAYDNALAAGDDQTAVLAGGCYWGMQYVFEHVKGVKQVVAGFAGAPLSPNATDPLSRGEPPAEAIKITFDPAQISYGRLLRVYFSVAHDPTEIDRQGPDVGPQYRSEIFYGDDSQQKIAQTYIAQLQKSGVFGAPVATTLSKYRGFRRVPESQQDYVTKNPNLPYVVAVDRPKLPALKSLLPELYREVLGPMGPG